MITSWIIPANVEIFKINECLAENDFVDWAQGNFKFNVGDIVYFYLSGKDAHIRYKMEITALNLGKEVYDNDSKYWTNLDMFAKSQEKSRYMRLKLVKDLGETDMSLSRENLFANGLTTCLQGRIKIHDKLLEYIESRFETKSLLR